MDLLDTIKYNKNKIILSIVVAIIVYFFIWLCIISSVYKPISEAKCNYKSTNFVTGVATPHIFKYSGYCMIEYEEDIDDNTKEIHRLYIYPKILGDNEYWYWVDTQIYSEYESETDNVVSVYLDENMKPIDSKDSKTVNKYSKQIKRIYEEANKAFGLDL